MITGKGFIKDGQGRVQRAEIHQTRSGVEYATLENGLALFPSAYEWEQVYEVDDEDDALDVNALMADIEAGRR